MVIKSSKLFIKIVFVIVCIFVSISCFAQTSAFSDTLQWNVSSIVDTNTQESFQVQTIFVTYGNSKIEWIQNGNVKRTLSVQDSDINWAELSSDGEAVFNINQQNINGSVTFKKLAGVVTVQFSFQKNGKPWLPFRFSISSVQTKN